MLHNLWACVLRQMGWTEGLLPLGKLSCDEGKCELHFWEYPFVRDNWGLAGMSANSPDKLRNSRIVSQSACCWKLCWFDYMSKIRQLFLPLFFNVSPLKCLTKILLIQYDQAVLLDNLQTTPLYLESSLGNQVFIQHNISFCTEIFYRAIFLYSFLLASTSTFMLLLFTNKKDG